MATPDLDAAVDAHPEGALVRVRVVPRAPRTAVVGPYGDAVKCRVKAPPVEGAANRELCRHLARLTGIAVREAEVVAGARGRDKAVLLRGVDRAVALTALGG